MTRAETLAHLNSHADDIRRMGATALYLFGSASRDEARADSDLDLFVDYDPAGRFNAFDLVGIKLFLEDRLKAEVDLTTRDGLHPLLRDAIERSAIRVFDGAARSPPCALRYVDGDRWNPGGGLGQDVRRVRERMAAASWS